MNLALYNYIHSPSPGRQLFYIVLGGRGGFQLKLKYYICVYQWKHMYRTFSMVEGKWLIFDWWVFWVFFGGGGVKDSSSHSLHVDPQNQVYRSRGRNDYLH